jgi:hypothetical protein
MVRLMGSWPSTQPSSRHRGIAASRHRGIAASRHRGIAASRHRKVWCFVAPVNSVS